MPTALPSPPDLRQHEQHLLALGTVMSSLPQRESSENLRWAIDLGEATADVVNGLPAVRAAIALLGLSRPPTATAALRQLVDAALPFLAQEYRANDRVLSPGLSLGQWTDLQTAVAQAQRVLKSEEAPTPDKIAAVEPGARR